MVTHAQKRVDVRERDVSSPVSPVRWQRLLPLVLLFAMLCVMFFIDAVLPLQDLSFYLAFPNSVLGSHLLLPTRLLFPGKAVDSIAPSSHIFARLEAELLLTGIVALFALYLLAIRLLPKRITQGYILLSTALLGFVFVFFAAMTSQDVFVYIAYARMGVIYHLNALTTAPTAIKADPVYTNVFWIHQPSVYGPTWTIITSALQWGALLLGLKSLMSITLLLKLLSLVMHLGSTQLIWMLGGSLQRLTGNFSQRRRLFATLAFAWNPLLLFEACVNAHNDTTLLFFVLLALWFLLPRGEQRRQPVVMAVVFLALATCLKITIIVILRHVVFLALATCLKITIIVFFPLLLLYLWKQQSRRVQHAIIATAVYVSVIVLLYAPFWQHGAALHVIENNPGTSRDINGPYEFLVHFYEAIRHRQVAFVSPDVGTSTEKLTYKISFVLFCTLYGIYWLRTLFTRRALTTLPSLISTMALVWLIYCFLGSPWLWPWYLTTFFGLFALIEVTGMTWTPLSYVFRMSLAPCLLSFALLSIYCFSTWIAHKTYVPHLYFFQWTYLRGLWLCVIPLLALRIPLPAWHTHRQSSRQTQELPQLSLIRRFIGGVHFDSLRRR